MRVLLTGSHGFIGSHLRKALGLKEKDCWDVKRDMNRTIFAIEPKDMEGYDVVVHLAALISGDESWEKPNDYLFTNTVGTLNLVRNAIEAGVKRFVFASSAAIYGNPLTPYGASKKAAEAVLESYKEDIEVGVLRFFNVYGRGQNPQYAGVISKLVEASREGRPFFIYGDGENTRDYIHVSDIVGVIKKYIGRKSLFPFPIDIGTGKETSVNDQVKLISKITGKKVLVRQGVERREIRRSVASGSYAEELLGKKCVNLEDGLRKLYGPSRK